MQTHYRVFQSPNDIPISLATWISGWSVGRNFVLLAASSSGTETMLPPRMATILPYCLFAISYAAAVPNLVASTRSYGHGGPPR